MGKRNNPKAEKAKRNLEYARKFKKRPRSRFARPARAPRPETAAPAPETASASNE